MRVKRIGSLAGCVPDFIKECEKNGGIFEVYPGSPGTTVLIKLISIIPGRDYWISNRDEFIEISPFEIKLPEDLFTL